MKIEVIENFLGMKLAVIPPGNFFMGSLESEIDRDIDEGPRHRVTISSPLIIGIYPVTQAQYERVMHQNYSRFKSPDRPAEMVSHPDASDFCSRLSEITGDAYSLPTEAQWEYACRAGIESTFAFGDDPRNLDDYAWHAGNSSNTTHSVGQKKANAFGLYDMHGNVWEWCRDHWSAQGYNPTQNRDPESQGFTYNLRGGCYYSHPQALRSAKRFGYNQSNRYDSVGFRVIRVD